jgi:hypothetical protein
MPAELRQAVPTLNDRLEVVSTTVQAGDRFEVD